MNFTKLGLSENISNTLSKQNINSPTQIQELAITEILKNSNVIIKSQTGSGKTFAYLLPLFERNLEKGNQIIIIVPTRELAMQVHNVIIDFANLSNIDLKSAVAFGGVNIKNQIEKLKLKPQIIIGTVDRIYELIKKKKIAVNTINTFIVDEADKLISKENISDLVAIRKCLLRDIQSVFVSATFSDQNVEKLKEFTPNLQYIKAQEKEVVPQNIMHFYLTCEKRDKLENLRKIIGIMNPSKSLIFINDLNEINTAVAKLIYHKLNCMSIHSETSKQQRQKALKDFSNGELNHLVSTDLASRGIHIDDITCVYNMSIAENPSDYLHRSGRTGRQEKAGISINLATKNEVQFLKKYQSRYDIKIYEIKMKNGEITYFDDDKNIQKL